jgi:class 3 adenylate cyclase
VVSDGKFIRSVWSLRTKDHIETRLQIRDEKAFAYRLFPWLAVVDVGFGFVDWLSVPGSNPLVFFGIRLVGILMAYFLYRTSRGRASKDVRVFLVTSCIICPVELIMVSQHLSLSPYFAGTALVMITGTNLFPIRLWASLVGNAICIAPVLGWIAFHPIGSRSDIMNMILMTIGSVVVCAVNSGQTYEEMKRRMLATEALARDLGSREKEVRAKVAELLKRRTFESQFSPQVVKAVLDDASSVREMRQLKVVMIVIDIENSTTKAKALHPRYYKEVIEEVFDVFSSACLKWNITVDKFTGDGGQAFAGAPVSIGDDFERALAACKDMVNLLFGRKPYLEFRWRDPLNVRFAVCEGMALVGFLGRGTLKSYTAIGETVSFTHRLCAVPPPWVIAAYSRIFSYRNEPAYAGFEGQQREVTGLKGFGTDRFPVIFLKPESTQEQIVDTGRCPTCQTPLVLIETVGGLPKLVCPGCQAGRAA